MAVTPPPGPPPQPVDIRQITPEASGKLQVRTAVRSALVIVPVNLAAPPVVTLRAMRSSVAVAVSTVIPRIVAPPVRVAGPTTPRLPATVALLIMLRLPPCIAPAIVAPPVELTPGKAPAGDPLAVSLNDTLLPDTVVRSSGVHAAPVQR